MDSRVACSSDRHLGGLSAGGHAFGLGERRARVPVAAIESCGSLRWRSMADIVLCGAGKQSLSSVVSGRALAQGRDPFATQHQRSGTSSAWSVHTAACCFCCCRHRRREPTNDHHIVIAISSVACSLYEIVQEEANTNGPHEQATRARSLSRATHRHAAQRSIRPRSRCFRTTRTTQHRVPRQVAQPQGYVP